MSVAMMLLVAGIALGGAGYYFANSLLSTGGFALAVAALLAWVVRSAWQQRTNKDDDSSTYVPAAADIADGHTQCAATDGGSDAGADGGDAS